MRINCYLPRANCTNSSLIAPTRQGCAPQRFASKFRNFVTHVFGLLPTPLSTLNMGNRLQNAARAFQANKWILCDKNVWIALRLKFFHAMLTSVVCFAAGHPKVYVGALRKLDAHCRKLLRRMVGPPPDINWNGPCLLFSRAGTSRAVHI